MKVVISRCMKVVIFGSRILSHVRRTPKPTPEEKATYEAAKLYLKGDLINLWKHWKDLYGPITQVIEGDANGMDKLGKEMAPIFTGKKALTVKAEWYKDGIKAGMLRNEKMANLADGGIYISLPGSVGTRDMKERLEARGLPVIGLTYTLNDLEFMIPGIADLYTDDLSRSKEKAKAVRNRSKKVAV